MAATVGSRVLVSTERGLVVGRVLAATGGDTLTVSVPRLELGDAPGAPVLIARETLASVPRDDSGTTTPSWRPEET